MDPYLEQAAIWPDFHDRFINCWSEAIAEKLPPRYDVRIADALKYDRDPIVPLAPSQLDWVRALTRSQIQ